MSKHDLQDLGGGSFSGMLADRAHWAPDNVLLYFEGQQFTYGEVDRQASAFAAGVMALGLNPGDAISTFMTNRPEYLFATYGANRAGLVGTSVNTMFKASFLAFPIEYSESKILITEALLAPALMTMGTLPSLRFIVYVDGVPAEVPAGITALSWEDLLAGGKANQSFPTLLPSDLCAISFTSGTTGRSKGVLSPNLQGIVMGKESATANAITPRDRMYTCMPLFHGMAQVTTGYAAVYAGAAIVLSRRFSVTAYWDEIRKSQATQSSALGSMLQMLLAPPPSPSDREHVCTRIFSAPAPPEVLYKFERRYGTHVIEGYGSTEIKNVLYNPLDARKIGSMGKPTATTILEIHDTDGNRVQPGEVGEIVYRPKLPNIMLMGYHKEPEKTLAQMRGLWWHTGDMGSMDSDGYFYFFDRTADRLRRRGENISSMEVEGVLAAYPGVQEAAAIAAPSDVGEDEVLAVLEVADPATFDFPALFTYCCAGMPRFMVPRYFRLVPSLPRTPTGKVRKTALRDEGITSDTWDHVQAGLTVPR